MDNQELIAAHRVDQERRGLLPNSIHRRDQAAKVFARSLGGRSLLEATRNDVEEFLDARPIGPRTRYLWLTHLHNFYEWVIRDEIGASDPTARIIRPRLPRALPRPASSVELRAALEQADPTRRCWLLLAAFMGLRCQEVAGMSRQDVLESEGLLRVVKGKGGVERILPLHPEVLSALGALPMPRVGWVFTRPRGGPYPAAQLSHDFNIFLRSAGVSGSTHTLRHWFGTNLYAQTHDIRLTQEMLGHANMATTAIYTAFDRRAAGHAVGALNFDPDPPEPTSGRVRHLRSVS
jgi:integrase/recombinase XerC